MSEDLAAALRVLPDYLGHHVRLSAAALVLGLFISLPLAVAASRSARLRWPLLTFASLIQTIPSLALLALFYPLLLLLSSASQAVFGHGAPVVSVDESSIRHVRGARLIRKGDFLGVVAPTEYAAIQAAAQLRVKWADPPRTLPGR